MLVGDGDFSQFSELMDSTYYTLYDEFDVGQKVGVVVINRQRMKNKLFSLYQNWDAVNKILEKSRPTLPENISRSAQSSRLLLKGRPCGRCGTRS